MRTTTARLPALSLSVLAAVVLWAMAAEAQAAATEEQMDRLVAQTVKPDGPGCAILVVDDGQIVFERAYGIADLYLDLPKEKPAHPPTPVTYPVAQVDPAIYAGFVGKYCIDDGTVFAVSTQDNRLGSVSLGYMIPASAATCLAQAKTPPKL